MSLSVLNEIEIMPSMEGIEISEPRLLKKGVGPETKYYPLNRYSASYIYNKIGIKPKVSSDLFHLDENIWSSVIQSKYDNSELEFKDHRAIMFRGSVIEIIENQAFDPALFEEFIAKIKKNATDSSMTSFGTLNVIFKKDNAIMIASLSFNKAWYSLHGGFIEDNSYYVLYPTADIETASFVQFMYQFNNSFDDFMNNVEGIAKQDNKTFGFSLNEKLSLREMYDIVFKGMACSAELDEDGYITSIPGVSTDNSEILVGFFNSFGLTFKSLKKLSYLRKTFRSGKITAEEMLKILTEEFKSDSLDISAYTIANVCNLCSTDEFDKKIIAEELHK